MVDRRGGKKENGLPDPNAQHLRFYKFVIDSLPTAVITVNAGLKITGFNAWAEKTTGFKAKEAVGHFCGEILQGGMCHSSCPLRTALKGRKPVSLVETVIHNKRGEVIPVRMNTAGLFDNDGRLIGGVESFQDISHLKALEREKNNLISMLAHDMKSSLTIIGGFVLRLLKKADRIEPKKEKHYLEIVKKESGKLEVLIADFLEFSRLQTGRLKLNLSATSVDKELMELYDSYKMQASEAGLELVLRSEEQLPIVQADSRQLRRVFTNLLDNAIKFSKEKGTIAVSTHETADEIVVEVRDEGIGIDPDEIPYVFDAFHRGRKTENKRTGFGLGLAAVKAIVEGHGGRVNVESELGKGSLFTVSIPKKSREEHEAGAGKGSFVS